MVIKFPPRKPYDPGVRVGWPAVTIRRPVARPRPNLAWFLAGLARIDREARVERLWSVLAALAELAAICLLMTAIAVGAALYIGAVL